MFDPHASPSRRRNEFNLLLYEIVTTDNVKVLPSSFQWNKRNRIALEHNGRRRKFEEFSLSSHQWGKPKQERKDIFEAERKFILVWIPLSTGQTIYVHIFSFLHTFPS